MSHFYSHGHHLHYNTMSKFTCHKCHCKTQISNQFDQVVCTTW